MGTGSGCSAYEPQPSWQAGIVSGCSKRAVADVSAVADPSTGTAMYDSYSEGGWMVVGGTSVATPIIASAYALAGAPKSGSYPASYLYAHYATDPSAFNDVTSGSDGSCIPAVLCTAGPGWDGPTGLGTPRGVTGWPTRRSGR
jgi:subtilase family serine protease